MGCGKLLLQLFTAFGIPIIGIIILVNNMSNNPGYSIDDIGLGGFVFMVIFWIVINIIVAGWRMNEPGYDANADAKNAWRVLKTCPHCMKKLPSYFTSKCPHCTANL